LGKFQKAYPKYDIDQYEKPVIMLSSWWITIPHDNFWSFTNYDSQTRSMQQTDYKYPAIGAGVEPHAKCTC
jgi:hypothetical protein